MFKKIIALVIIALLVAAGLIAMTSGSEPDVVVGSKHFTEQKILGEMVAQLLEAKTDLRVGRRIGLGSTMISFGALQEGDIDVYPEYTGTGLVSILNRDYDPSQDPGDVLQFVRKRFGEKWNLRWLAPLGFGNTYAYAMREGQAKELGIRTVSDLEEYRDRLKPGFDHEFLERPEYKRFDEVYGFRFEKEVVRLDPDVMYRAIKNKEVDVIDAFATDGRIAAYDLRVLEDDENLFPPYDACLLVRNDALEEFPQIKPVLEQLDGRITTKEMQNMNYAVTDEMRSPSAVAREFLEKEGLIDS